MSFARYRFGWPQALICSIGLCLLIPGSSHSRPEEDLQDDEVIQPDGIHVLDGSYVLDVGEFQVNITNHGLIGSQFTNNLPFSSCSLGRVARRIGARVPLGRGIVGRRQGQRATGRLDRPARTGIAPRQRYSRHDL